ncbi:protein of unknown function DUF795 [Lachnospiraceae bacterium KM106-2]|nr:protein of unknown function DUF795 [Lachnospiraceae bacterium KM106-2]
MKVVGLITEYNPFHNGHKYHIEKAKEMTGADYVVVVMSGNFVQRGTPAVTDKYTRTKMALLSGADLVIELPVRFATASAELFATGAIKLLSSLGIVDSICFGTECGDISILTEIAELLCNEPDSYKALLNECLKKGDSFPVARAKALSELLNDPRFITVLQSPNNILGIEYIKAILKTNSHLRPFTITRKVSGYHSSSLEDTNASDEISSASAIRGYVASHNQMDLLHKHIPKESFECLMQAYQQTFPIDANDFSLVLYYKLLFENLTSLCDYLDINSDLAGRILNTRANYQSYCDFADQLKSKNITHTRATRMLCHILLNIKNDNTISQDPDYLRILGIKKSSTHLLRTASKLSKLPLITKVADARNAISADGMTMLMEDINAAHLYNEIIFEKYHYKMKDEYRVGILLL